MTALPEPPVLDMLALASAMTRQATLRGKRNPAYADMFTSMCDLRTAANLARGVPVERITSLGYPNLEWTRASRLANGAPYQ